MNIQMNKKITPIKYGFFGAIIGTVFFFLLVLSGNSPWGSSSWMGCWIPGMSAYFAIKTMQQQSKEPEYSFSSLFRIGMTVHFFQALIYAILTILIIYLFSIQVLETYKAEMLANAEQIKTVFSSEMYNQLLVELKYITVATLVFWDFIYKLTGGILVSLILAGFLKNSKPVLRKIDE